MAATETKDPEKWLAYAQDRKAEDSRYSVFDFRKDVRVSHTADPAAIEGKEAHEDSVGLPSLGSTGCPWVRQYCSRSGQLVPVASCTECEFGEAG